LKIRAGENYQQKLGSKRKAEKQPSFLIQPNKDPDYKLTRLTGNISQNQGGPGENPGLMGIYK
jgi:hypothetical protein